jgi:ribosomal protein L37E
MGIGSVQVPCFGIVDEHLHIKCARCGFDWLMAVKGGK